MVSGTARERKGTPHPGPRGRGVDRRETVRSIDETVRSNERYCGFLLPGAGHRAPLRQIGRSAMMDKHRLGDVEFGFAPPIDRSDAPAVTLWATCYYIPTMFARPRGQRLKKEDGAKLKHKLSKRDFCLAALEGTVRVIDRAGHATIYNYAGKGRCRLCDCSPIVPHLDAKQRKALGRTRWEVSRAPFGTGADGMALVPYRSIAVDRDVVPLWSVVYVPEARGTRVTLPSGRTAEHDGYFYAADTGGAVKDEHIDVFCGLSGENPFGFVTSDENERFEAYIVKDSALGEALAALHRICDPRDGA
jgi:3D (Asp-Asp-Asp) domain-containing protein